mmetsp:Transcript_147212/g.472844  ORF Transcript_147212/g.472844 Transcript_147212/m.472844 type:complete len:234 (+) Transcript_147212:312-1013(+)
MQRPSAQRRFATLVAPDAVLVPIPKDHVDTSDLEAGHPSRGAWGFLRADDPSAVELVGVVLLGVLLPMISPSPLTARSRPWRWPTRQLRGPRTSLAREPILAPDQRCVDPHFLLQAKIVASAHEGLHILKIGRLCASRRRRLRPDLLHRSHRLTPSLGRSLFRAVPIVDTWQRVLALDGRQRVPIVLRRWLGQQRRRHGAGDARAPRPARRKTGVAPRRRCFRGGAQIVSIKR